MNKSARPLVTIVTITYDLIKLGRETLFRQCVQSVKDQDYDNIEHIIIDGASSDGTRDLVTEYSNKGWVKYISEKDGGLYDAMNKGIAKANGKYLAFLHSDDYYHNKSAISLSIRALERDGADFSYANFIMVGKNKRYIEKGDLNRFLYIMPFGHPTMFTKTEVLKREGGFDETIGLPADYDLIIRLILKNYHAVYVDSEIVTYRLGGLGTTTDHANEIGKIFLKNYSVFYNFSDISEAKKIMYERVLPKNFSSCFTIYARENNLNNIDVKRVVMGLDNLEPLRKIHILRERLKTRLRHYPFLIKIWDIIK